MEFVILYSTENFNKDDGSKDPITRDSVIKHFEFNPEKKYEIKSVITQATIDEHRGLYETSTANFYTYDVGTLVESPNLDQTAYIAGSLGLSLDRYHIERSHYIFMDLLAYAGGVIVVGYLLVFVLTYLY